MSNLSFRIIAKPAKRITGNTGRMSMAQTINWINGELLEIKKILICSARGLT